MTEQTFPYQGSKSKQLDVLYDFFPDHKGYVEVFGGSGIVLLNKEPINIEVLNDYNCHVYNFFNVLKNHTMELIANISLTPYSRKHLEEVESKINEFEPEGNNIKWAADWFVAQTQSFNGRIGAGMRNINHKKKFVNVVQYLGGKTENLFGVANRLKNAIIEKLDFEDCINKYSGGEIFFYLDPPYIQDTKNESSVYKSEMSDKDHERMLDAILSNNGKYLISGYKNSMYDRLLDNGFDKAEYSVTTSMDGKHSDRTETLWFNYDPQPTQVKLI